MSSHDSARYRRAAVRASFVRAHLLDACASKHGAFTWAMCSRIMDAIAVLRSLMFFCDVVFRCGASLSVLPNTL